MYDYSIEYYFIFKYVSIYIFKINKHNFINLQSSIGLLKKEIKFNNIIIYNFQLDGISLQATTLLNLAN